MKAEERIAQLEAENAALREQVSQLLVYVTENAVLHEQVTHLQARLAELERRLAKDSHNSSKPPSSDGLARKGYWDEEMRLLRNMLSHARLKLQEMGLDIVSLFERRATC